MKKPVLYLVVICALAGIGLLGSHLFRPALVAAEQKPAAAQQRGGSAARAITVNAQKAVVAKIEDSVSAVGSLLAAQSVELAPEVDGRIVTVSVSDGQSVSADDLLFQLDDTVTAAELAQSEAELSLARADLKRASNLARNSFVSERSREEAAANVKVLRAKLQVVRARLAKARIRAPFGGRIGLVNVSPGEYVKSGTALVRLDDLSSLKLDLRVPERLVARVQPGQTIRVSFDAYPGREFLARVETVDTAIDDVGRSLVVRGRLDNADNLLRPGMFARARLILGTRNSAVMVPEESIMASADGQYLFAVREGKAQRQPVRTGVRQNGNIEIIEGVAAGELVVTAGQVKLRGNNLPVKIVAPVDGVGGRQDAFVPAPDRARG